MKKAKGRSLSDFEKLLPAEKLLLQAFAEGRPALIGTELPTARTDSNEVRADVLAFFAMGGDEKTHPSIIVVSMLKVRGSSRHWICSMLKFQATFIFTTAFLINNL